MVSICKEHVAWHILALSAVVAVGAVYCKQMRHICQVYAHVGCQLRQQQLDALGASRYCDWGWDLHMLSMRWGGKTRLYICSP